MKRKIKIAINFIILISLAISIYSYLASLDYLNTSDNLLSIKAEDFSDGINNLSLRKLKDNEFGIYSYSASFNINELPQSNQQYSVVVTRLSGQSFKVFLNGVYIGSAGEFNGIQSSIWNGIYTFSFDKRILKQENTLQLDIVGLYELGLSDFPVVIGSVKTVSKIQSSYQLSHNIAKGIGVGILIACCIIMIIFYFIFNKSPRRKAFLYIALALFFSLFYVVDLFSINYIPLSFILYKKINITAIYLTLMFSVLGYTEYYNIAKHRVVAYITVAISLAGAVFAKNMPQFKTWYDIYILLIPINIIVLKIATILKKQRSFSNELISICTSYALLTIILPILNEYFNIPNDMFYCILPVILLPICITIVVIIMGELNSLQFKARGEEKRFRYFYNKSITDGLTGLYNYRFMLDYLEKIEPVYTVFLFDIDNLKEINDNLGHLAGNNAILMITNTLKNYLPEKSVAGRFGGDEFMVIVFGDVENAKQIIEKVRLSVASTKISNSNLNVSLSIGMYVVTQEEAPEDIIDKADKAMYLAKKTGKNCLVQYDN